MSNLQKSLCHRCSIVAFAALALMAATTSVRAGACCHWDQYGNDVCTVGKCSMCPWSTCNPDGNADCNIDETACWLTCTQFVILNHPDCCTAFGGSLYPCISEEDPCDESPENGTPVTLPENTPKENAGDPDTGCDESPKLPLWTALLALTLILPAVPIAYIRCTKR